MLTLLFDTETTGIPKHPHAKDSVQPRIIEFAGILSESDGTVLHELEFLCNPGIKLEPIITKITGLTDDDLKDEPQFGHYVWQLREFFGRAEAMLAHNLPFDSTMIQLELARHAPGEEFPWPEIRICSVQETAEYYGRRAKLLELYELCFGVPLEQTHRALDDVKAMAKVCAHMGLLP